MIKKLIKWIKSLFSSQPSVPLKKKDIAIVVGHNHQSKGAVNYKGESEWDFNSRIAVKLSTELEGLGISSSVLYRPSGKTYKDQVKVIKGLADELKVKACLCLHFNSFNEPILGCEMLVSTDPNRSTIGSSTRLAELLANQLSQRLKITKRHINGVMHVKANHSGFRMLQALTNKKRAAVIVEPCFGNTRNHDSHQIFENEGTYVIALSRAVRQFMKDL